MSDQGKIGYFEAMRHRSGRIRHALALACGLLVVVASAQAATTLDLPARVAAPPHALTDGDGDEVGGPDPFAIAVVLDSFERNTALAPRVADKRPLLAERTPLRPAPFPRCARAAVPFQTRFASRSGCAELARWCLAHSTATEAP
jgi:hypothetical protein